MVSVVCMYFFTIQTRTVPFRKSVVAKLLEISAMHLLTTLDKHPVIVFRDLRSIVLKGKVQV